jgi:hypothetical protein
VVSVSIGCAVVVTLLDGLGPTRIGVAMLAISNKRIINAAKIRRIHDDFVDAAGATLVSADL